jgi:hypothetical protein
MICSSYPRDFTAPAHRSPAGPRFDTGPQRKNKGQDPGTGWSESTPRSSPRLALEIRCIPAGPVAARIPWNNPNDTRTESFSRPRRSRADERAAAPLPHRLAPSGRIATTRAGPGGERRPSWCPRSEAGSPGTVAVASSKPISLTPRLDDEGAAAPDGLARSPAAGCCAGTGHRRWCSAAISVGRPLDASILRPWRLPIRPLLLFLLDYGTTQEAVVEPRPGPSRAVCPGREASCPKQAGRPIPSPLLLLILAQWLGPPIQRTTLIPCAWAASPRPCSVRRRGGPFRHKPDGRCHPHSIRSPSPRWSTSIDATPGTGTAHLLLHLTIGQDGCLSPAQAVPFFAAGSALPDGQWVEFAAEQQQSVKPRTAALRRATDRTSSK